MFVYQQSVVQDYK